MRTALLATLLLAACASEQPAGTAGFDDSAGVVDVTVCGDDFVRCAGERLPLDAFVLRLRQRTRAMTRDQLDRFVVHLRMASDIPAGEPAKVAYANKNRLLDELHVMGVTQVRYL